MKIAVPVVNGKLSLHFGHCERFVFFDADPDANKILFREDVEAPPHQPGFLPPWMAQKGVNVVLAGGMGGRAIALFAEAGIKVVVGCPLDTPERIVNAFLEGTLKTGGNVCGDSHHCGDTHHHGHGGCNR